jgi:hypothetical protein
MKERVRSQRMQQCGLCARFTRDGENIPSGNRDPETGITPMDNFVCWRCQREARGAFMLMGRPAQKWLVKHRRQIELALAAR